MKVLCVGSARCAFEDIAAAKKLGEFDAVAVVNDMGVMYEDRIDYWVTLHPEKFNNWQRLREREGHSADYCAITFEQAQYKEKGSVHPRIDKVYKYLYDGMTGSASSGLFAATAMLEEGFDRIVLAGIPLTAKGNHLAKSGPWTEVGGFRVSFMKLKPRLKDKVKSMSGWTMEQLGKPDPLWLNSGAENE